MNFDLTEEQVMLEDALKRLLANAETTSIWLKLAEAGALAAPFTEADGGLGMGPVETFVIAKALGGVLAREPYLASIVLGGTVLRTAPASARRAALIPEVAAGEHLLAFAHAEPGQRNAVAPRTLAARRDGNGYVLDGVKAGVLHGDIAHSLIVSANADGKCSLFAVSAAATGVLRRAYRLFDASSAADVTFEAVHVDEGDCLAIDEPATESVEAALQNASAYRAAEALGTMEMVIEATAEHLKTRKQFGQTLSKFQALQHKAAEMLIELEQARSMAMYAAMMVEERDPVARREAFAAIDHVVANAARFIAQTSVQLHGGIGVTEEHRVGRAFRRLTMTDLALTDSRII